MSAGNTQKSLAVGDLRYDVLSVSTRVSFYTQGVVSASNNMFLINSKLTDEIIDIIKS